MKGSKNYFKKVISMLITVCLVVGVANIPAIKGSHIELLTSKELPSLSYICLVNELRYISKAITDGIAASEKKSGRKTGQLDKMTKELQMDIELYLGDRSIKQIELMNKHKISRNTLKKYITHVIETDERLS